MYFGLSEDQIMLQDSVRRFLETQSELEHVRVYAEGDDALAPTRPCSSAAAHLRAASTTRTR